MSAASEFEFFAPGFHVDASAIYRAYTWQIWCFGIAGFLGAVVQYLLAVPNDLRHLPRVSPYATIWSYARREPVDRRVKRLILPFAERGEGVVLVYMLGKWGVHVLDAHVRLTSTYLYVVVPDHLSIEIAREDRLSRHGSIPEEKLPGASTLHLPQWT